MTSGTIPPLAILHLHTQDGQPYGSESRKCELCGVMIWGPNPPRWTDQREAFETGEIPAGFMKCNGKLPWERDLEAEFKAALALKAPPVVSDGSPGVGPGVTKVRAESELRGRAKLTAYFDDAQGWEAPKGRADTDEKKAVLLGRLLTVWRKIPEMRLGQLLVNYMPGVKPNPMLFYLEDEDLVVHLEKLLEQPEEEGSPDGP